jgi:Ala-tRNA(Pro) deacylase
MVVARKLKAFLDEHRVPYHVLRHHERFVASEIAEALHVPGQELAKVVMVKVDGKLKMAVLPASVMVNLDAFARAAGGVRAELATEAEFKDAFPDCEVGAMPPFGNLYGIEVWVDNLLTVDRAIVFEAGNHHEAVKLAYRDFARLVRPRVADFAASLETAR